MHKWQYIFASVVVLAFAIVVASFAPAISQQSKSASYMITAEDATFIWRVNIADGSVSYCQRDSAFSTNPELIRKQKPVCSTASDPAAH